MKPFSKKWGPQSALAIQIGLNSLVGFLFLKILAVYYGTSAQKDGFDIAYSVPYLIMSVSGFTFLHSIITTQFSKMLAAESREINRVFSSTLTFMLTLGGLLMLGCALFARSIADLLAPGLAPGVRQEMQVLIVWMCPLVFTLGVSTYLSAILNAHGIPVAMEFGQLLSRIGVIAGALLFHQRYSLVEIAGGLVLFSTLGLIAEWILLVRKTNVRYQLSFQWGGEEFRAIARQGGGFLIAALGAQMSMSYMRRLGTIAGPGTTASMTYALSLAGPLTLIIGKPLALTRGLDFVRHSERGEWREALRLFNRCVLLCLAVSVTIAILGDLFAVPLIQMLYRGGEFNALSVARTADLFRILNWTLPSAVLSSVTLVPLLNARRPQSAALIHTISYAVHALLTWLLFSLYGRFGLAWAVLAPSTFQALVGTILLYRELLGKVAADLTPGTGLKPRSVADAGLKPRSTFTKSSFEDSSESGLNPRRRVL